MANLVDLACGESVVFRDFFLHFAKGLRSLELSELHDVGALFAPRRVGNDSDVGFMPLIPMHS